MKYITILAISLMAWLAGCSSDSQVEPVTEVLCAGAHNDGQASHCQDYVASSGIGFITTAHAAETTVNLGNISRGTMIVGEGIVDNPLQVDFHGYAQFEFVTGGCNGAYSWMLMPKQPVTVQAGNIRDVVGAGGMCTDMPLGQHTAVATVWADDGIQVIGEVIINFNLVE